MTGGGPGGRGGPRPNAHARASSPGCVAGVRPEVMFGICLLFNEVHADLTSHHRLATRPRRYPRTKSFRWSLGLSSRHGIATSSVTCPVGPHAM